MTPSSCATLPSLVSLPQKFTNSKDPMLKKVFPICHVLLVSLITGYLNGFCLPMVAIGPQILSRICPLVWPAALAKCFLEGFTRQQLARARWYRLLCDCYHRLSAVPERRMVPHRSQSDHSFRLQVPKWLNRHADKHHWPGPDRTSSSAAMNEFMKSRRTKGSPLSLHPMDSANLWWPSAHKISVVFVFWFGL